MCDTTYVPPCGPPDTCSRPASGLCTLRAALGTATRHPGLQIGFNLPAGAVIRPVKQLGFYASGVSLIGSQGGPPSVMLDGANREFGGEILYTFQNGNLTIAGLAFGNGKSSAIWFSASNGNVFTGNYIGADVTGLQAAPNASWGLNLASGVARNQIGDGSSAGRNLIVSNGMGGVYLAPGATENSVLGNWVGVGADGRPLGNGSSGVKLEGASGTTVAGNLISNNSQNGVEIRPYTPRWNATGNLMQGNAIGTDAAGVTDQGNRRGGVAIFYPEANTNTIGGTAAGAGNLISGNDQNGGIYLGLGATLNTIQGNLIGVIATGSAALANNGPGIYVSASPNNTIGGARAGDACAGPCNLISGNQYSGIEIQGSASVQNRILGNFIGTNLAGQAAVGNSAGISISGAEQTAIGGVTAAQASAVPGNLISGNRGAGVALSSGANRSVVEGNRIGSNLYGHYPLGNGGSGISAGSTDNTIRRNLVVANGSNGVSLNATATSNTLQGNLIGGQSADELPESGLGNHDDGIYIAGSQNWLGGDGDEINVIVNNGGNGVSVVGSGDQAIRNRIRHNRIYGNAALGIDLGRDGVTANDEADPDSGPNRLQNYPVLGVLKRRGEYTDVNGTLNSQPNQTYRIELYHNPSCDASGYGEGKTYWTELEVTTDAAGKAAFQWSTAVQLPPGALVTALATDPDNNTSEFSRCAGLLSVNSTGRAADAAPGDGFCQTGSLMPNGDHECTLVAAIQEVNAYPDLSEIKFDIAGAGRPVIAIPDEGLPAVTAPGITIDGLSQPSAHQVELRGNLTVNYGLRLMAADSTVAGMVIHGFKRDGLLVAGDDATIRDSEIYNNLGHGILAQETATGAAMPATATRLRLDGVNIHNNDGDGVRMTGPDGELAMTETRVNLNAGDGVRLNGNLTVTGSDTEVNQNAQDGLNVSGNADVTALAANGNKGRGMVVTGDLLVQAFATFDGNGSGWHDHGLVVNGALDALNLTVTRNKGDGLQGRGSARLNNFDASSNVFTGLRLAGDLEVVGATNRAVGNGADGLRMGGRVTVQPGAAVTVRANRANGLVAVGNIILWSGIIEDNGTAAEASAAAPAAPNATSGNGLWSLHGGITLRNGVVQRNAGAGILAQRNVRIENSTVISNTGDGIRTEGSVLAAGDGGSLVQLNGGHGIYAGGFVQLEPGIVADRNAGDGVRSAGSYVIAQALSASGNGGYGVHAATDVTMWGGQVCSNAQGGVSAGGTATLQQVNLCANGGDGLQIGANSTGGAGGESSGPIGTMGQDSNRVGASLMAQCSVSGNGRDGIRYGGGAGLTVTGTNVAGNAGLGVNNAVTTALASRLQPASSSLRGASSAPKQSPPMWEIASAQTTGLAMTEVGMVSDMVDARNVWWGDASGPGGAGPGRGDEVSAGVTFSPWRTTPVALVALPADDPLLAPIGAPISAAVYLRNWVATTDTVRVQFSDAAGWLAAPTVVTVTLSNEEPGGTAFVTITVPADTAAGVSDVVTATATLQVSPTVTATAAFRVQAARVADLSLEKRA
ncbi:MAG: right-handed parallel beta-helix repeat-containing protein [Chloroflexi bacterium]|nr:right-handed parallel beta-helix repeat-containing protein [Chloroflexota bacterium]